MRILVTGASGWIGSATVAELLARGHDVVGLARSDASAAAVASLGADVVRGDLTDPASLTAAAADVDAVAHLAYDHDFSQTARALELDRAAITALGDGLRTGGGALAVIGGSGVRPGHVSAETDVPDPAGNPRFRNAELAFALADAGVRPMVVRFPPTVHGAGDPGFTARLVRIARDEGFSGYVGDGENRWPAVHRADAARLVALAVEAGPARAALHAVAEEGVATREIAEAIGERYGLPVRSVTPERVGDHFGWLGRFFSWDVPASSTVTRDLLGWQPVGPGLLEDVLSGAYDHA